MIKAIIDVYAISNLLNGSQVKELRRGIMWPAVTAFMRRRMSSYKKDLESK